MVFELAACMNAAADEVAALRALATACSEALTSCCLSSSSAWVFDCFCLCVVCSASCALKSRADWRTDSPAVAYIIYTADHGLSLGQHGLMGKQSLYEHSMKSPLIICGPQVPAGQSSSALTYVHDLHPTILRGWQACSQPLRLMPRIWRRFGRGSRPRFEIRSSWASAARSVPSETNAGSCWSTLKSIILSYLICSKIPWKPQPRRTARYRSGHIPHADIDTAMAGCAWRPASVTHGAAQAQGSRL